MFTGIIEHVGVVESVALYDAGGRSPQAEAQGDQIGARIHVNAGQLIHGLERSGSIAVNGCCLTAVDIDGDTFAADLSGETLRRTNLGQLRQGARVNLERPLTAAKELGGHFVQGHVDGVGRVARLDPEGANWWFGVSVPAELVRYIAMKGSIALNGISLTVAAWRDGIVEAAIIPYTYEHTNLSSMRPGDTVNIECDILAKYVERIVESRTATPPSPSHLTIAHLIEEGF